MKLTFATLSGDYAITCLPADMAVPEWASGPLCSVTRAEGELSIVCPASRVPSDIPTDTGWSALRIDTLATLDEPGVVMSAVTPISKAGFGVFVISTHLRDYLLVRSAELPKVKSALASAGHTID